MHPPCLLETRGWAIYNDLSGSLRSPYFASRFLPTQFPFFEVNVNQYIV